jgi:hypothetical protein
MQLIWLGWFWEKQIGLAISDVDYGFKVGHSKICKPIFPEDENVEAAKLEEAV